MHMCTYICGEKKSASDAIIQIAIRFDFGDKVSSGSGT